MRRKTLQYTLVLKAVKALQCHATAEEIYEEVQKADPNISRATVYRNLNKLCEEGELQKTNLPGESLRFDSNSKEHFHGRCVSCGKIFDIQAKNLPNIIQYLEYNDDFKASEYDIFFRGCCKECKNAKQ